MVSPLRTLGLLALVAFFLAALAVLFPGGKVYLTPAFAVRIIGPDDALPSPPPALKDISQAVALGGGLLQDGDSVEVASALPAPRRGARRSCRFTRPGRFPGPHAGPHQQSRAAAARAAAHPAGAARRYRLHAFPD